MSNAYINAYETSGAVLTNAGIALVKYANATRSTAGTTTIVSAVTNRKIRVLGFFITAEAAVNVQFQSGSSAIAANLAVQGIQSAYCPHGWFETNTGEALTFAIDDAQATAVQVVYVEVA